MSQIFNKIYDLAMSQRPYKKYARCYLKAINDQKPLAILEAGCGSGLFLRAMNEAGLNPVGLDQDPGMLKLAKKRVTNELILGDICKYSSPQRWNLIYLPLDVLNYLNKTELKKALKNLALQLENGGQILFDVHNKTRLKTMHEAIAKEIVPQGNFSWQSRKRGKYLIYNINCELKGNLENYRLKQRIHSQREIIKAARNANLSCRGVYRAWDLGRVDRKTARLFFAFVKG